MNQPPFEIIAAPFVLYIADLGTDFPALEAEPGVDWTKVGTNGALSYNDEGVTVHHEEDVEDFRMLGATGPLKSSRTSESLTIRLILHDLSLEQYAMALNFNPVTEDGDEKTLGLYRGEQMEQRALLLRGVSPYGAFPAQYEIPRARSSGEPEPVFNRSEPAGLELEFMALIDLDASDDSERFGRFRAQFQDTP